MKKILFISKKKTKFIRSNNIHTGWVNDCKDIYNIDFWGKYFNEDFSLNSLKKKIDYFKPDYIYLTHRIKYEGWLPDLTNIDIPKIFVENDTCYYNVNDPWYKQFTKLYCREPSWNGWDKIPLFRWSVPEKAFPLKKEKRKGIFFIGRIKPKVYEIRRKIRSDFKNYIKFLKITGSSKYWDFMKKASALVCPTENNFGNYTPTKLFEYLTSGAAVITNCDLEKAGIPELEPYIIRYTNLDDLKEKLKMDFTKYHNKAVPLMKNHIHRIRYKELFGE